MPFTLAHPAAVLPLFKNTKWFHAPALVLGSMAPDFEYFLRGKTLGIYGHTYAGQFWFNLPLVVLVYWVFMECGSLLPLSLYGKKNVHVFAKQKAAASCRTPKLVFVFIYSALIGMFTHLAWDSFTHPGGVMVGALPVLKKSIYGLPLCRVLQHASSVLGLAILAWWWNPFSVAKRLACHAKRNAWLWVSTAVLSSIVFTAWIFSARLPVDKTGTLVVRWMDSVMASFLVLAVFQKIKNRKRKTT